MDRSEVDDAGLSLALEQLLDHERRLALALP